MASKMAHIVFEARKANVAFKSTANPSLSSLVHNDRLNYKKYRQCLKHLKALPNQCKDIFAQIVTMAKKHILARVTGIEKRNLGVSVHFFRDN